ncbi:MAG: ribosome silencing factor [Firmicutes bacterium]|nr:ribosome silencing factor [Bacillota bacterium]
MENTLLESREFAFDIAEILAEKKAKDILVMGTVKQVGVADYFVLATAGSAVQAKTLADFVEQKLQEKQKRVMGRDGNREGRWIVLDYGRVFVHVFTEELRTFYNLEKLWGEGRYMFKPADIAKERESDKKKANKKVTKAKPAKPAPKKAVKK